MRNRILLGTSLTWLLALPAWANPTPDRPGMPAPGRPGTPRPDPGHQPPPRMRPDTGHFPPAHKVVVQPALACWTKGLDDKTYKLPAKGLRLESPVHCTLSAGPRVGDAQLTGLVRTKMGSKVRKSHEGPLNAATMKQDLLPGEDYDTCLDFTIEAEIRDANGKILGSKKLKLGQHCPD